MKQCSYKTHREDLCNFSKIDANATSQLLRGNTKPISNQYLNATRVYEYLRYAEIFSAAATFIGH